jgi:hypothetical protein
LSDCHGKKNCVRRTLKRILEAQKKAEKDHCNPCHNCTNLQSDHSKCKRNTIPFILYCDCAPFEATGVTTCFDECTQKEKFICFSTYIFKIIDLDEDCAVLELLKFKNHDLCTSSCGAEHFCSPCCQLSCENVEDLIPTCICIDIDLTCFCAIACLPAVSF